jgi:transposase
VRDYEPLRRDRRKRLLELRTGDGRPLGPHLKAQIERELDRLELLLEQVKTVEGARDRLLDRLVESRSQDATAPAEAQPSPVALLLSLNGVGPEFAASLWTEGLAAPSPTADRRAPTPT